MADLHNTKKFRDPINACIVFNADTRRFVQMLFENFKNQA